jgi:hypothetical protein
MFIIVDKETSRIIDTLQNKEIVDVLWIKTTHNSLIQLDMVDVFEVDNIPEDSKYYKDNQFTSYDPIQYQKNTNKYIERVKELVKLKYPDSDTEIAILRKYTAGIDIKNEFEVYNDYVEGCKLLAKTEFGLS